MGTVTSKDGTRIAFDQSGKGPAIIVVVGAFNDRSTGTPLARSLEQHFTVFNYDRRGRGETGGLAGGIGAGARPRAVHVEEQALRAEALDILSLFGARLLPRQDQPAYNLSYANRRRLEIARALALQPRLLLLDEPTAGMSAGETHETIRLLQRIAEERGLTLLFTEHDMEVVFGIAEKIAVLHQGRLIAEGSPAEVRNDPEVRRVYLGHGLAHA